MSNAQRVILVIVILLLVVGGAFAALYFTGVLGPKAPEESGTSTPETSKTGPSADPSLPDVSGEPSGQEDVWSEEWTKTEEYDSAVFSEFDRDTNVDSADATVVCDGANATVSGKGASSVKAENGTIAVSKGGTFILQGNYKGRILVSVPLTEKVRLIFDNFTITCASYTPVLCTQADKMAVILKDGTENFVIDNGSGYVKGADELEEMEGRSAGALHAKCDLTINGNGKLTVTGNYRHGIFSKDDLRILAGRIEVTASSSGIKGKKSVTIGGGSINVKADGDAVKVTETQKVGKGTFLMTGGVLTGSSKGDGIDVSMNVSVDGGRIKMTAGDHAIVTDGSVDIRGEKTVLRLAAESTGKGIRAFGDITVINGDVSVTRATEGIVSTAKGILVKGGRIRVNTLDECMESKAAMVISGGEILLNGQNAGVDTDTRLTQSGGTIFICAPTGGDGGMVELVTESGASAVWTSSGGRFIGFGTPGESSTPSDKSGMQTVKITGEFKAGTVYLLRDSNGNALAAAEPAFDCGTMIVSCPELKDGLNVELVSNVKADGVKTNGANGGGYYADATFEGGEVLYSGTVSGNLTKLGA